MKCVLCHGKLVTQIVEEELQVGSDHVMVELKANVCENCHERYFAEGTGDYLLNLKKEIKADKSQLKPIGQVYQAVL